MNFFWFCFVVLFLGLLPVFLMALWNLTLPVKRTIEVCSPEGPLCSQLAFLQGIKVSY
jgi:hypothetical protein